MSGPERPTADDMPDDTPDGKPDDQLLDDFLAGRSPVGKAYRDAAHESAPPALDEAVLREAHEQMLQPPAAVTPNQDHFRDRRWPFALAAVLVLSFSTLMLLREEQAKEQAAILPLPAAPEALPAESAAPSAEPQADAASRSRPEMLQRRESAPTVAASPPPPALRAQSKAESPAAAMEMEAAPAPQPAAPPAFHDDLADQPATGAAKSRAAAGMAADSAEERQQSAEAPEAWLQRIRELQAQGREAEARRELQAWREAYPEAAVPQDLRVLLPR